MESVGVFLSPCSAQHVYACVCQPVITWKGFGQRVRASKQDTAEVLGK